jgi:hypothetical protein
MVDQVVVEAVVVVEGDPGQGKGQAAHDDHVAEMGRDG